MSTRATRRRGRSRHTPAGRSSNQDFGLHLSDDPVMPRGVAGQARTTSMDMRAAYRHDFIKSSQARAL